MVSDPIDCPDTIYIFLDRMFEWPTNEVDFPDNYIIFILLCERIIDEPPENAALPLRIKLRFPTRIFSFDQVSG